MSKFTFRTTLGIAFKSWSEADCTAIYYAHDKNMLGPRVAKYVMLKKFNKQI